MIWAAALLATAPAVTFIAQGRLFQGLIILLAAFIFGAISLSIAAYWHKRDIHATPTGFIVALIFFVAGTVCLWWYGFFFWVPVALLALSIAYGYLTGKNK